MAIKITEEIYREAKKRLKLPEDDALVAAEMGFSMRIARQIRNTADYDAYCEVNRKRSQRSSGKQRQMNQSSAGHITDLDETIEALKDENRQLNDGLDEMQKTINRQFTHGFLVGLVAGFIVAIVVMAISKAA